MSGRISGRRRRRSLDGAWRTGYRSCDQRADEKYDVAIWAHHGIFCAGPDFDITFGLAHTVEKSAEILVKTLSIRPDKLQTITPEDFRALAKDFKVTLPERFLYETK